MAHVACEKLGQPDRQPDGRLLKQHTPALVMHCSQRNKISLKCMYIYLQKIYCSHINYLQQYKRMIIHCFHTNTRIS